MYNLHMKKRSRREGSVARNRVEVGDLENTQLGQLMAYQVGCFINTIQAGGDPTIPMLGIYMEGRKVCLALAKST